MLCNKCNSAEAVYDSPDNLCENCWAEWFASDENGNVDKAYKKEIINNLNILNKELSRSENAILFMVGFGSLSRERLSASLNGALGREEFHNSLHSLCKQGLLQKINNHSLRECRLIMKEFGIKTPLYGYPSVNNYDFTDEGAEIYKDKISSQYGKASISQFIISTQKENVSEIYAPTEEEARQCIESYEHRVQSVETVGRWAPYWWNGFDSGCKLTAWIKPERK